MEYLATSGTTIIAGCSNGAFYSSNGGGTWSTGLGTEGIDVRAIVPVETDLLAGTSLFRNFVSTDNGSTWTKTNTGFTGTSVWCYAVKDSEVLANR